MGEGPTAKPATWPAPAEMFGQGELRAAAPCAQARGWHRALRRGLEFSQSCASASRKREVYPQPWARHADFALPYSGMGRVHPGPAHGWGERGACRRMRHRSVITDPPHGRSGESLCARAQQELLHCCFWSPSEDISLTTGCTAAAFKPCSGARHGFRTGLGKSRSRKCSSTPTHGHSLNSEILKSWTTRYQEDAQKDLSLFASPILAHRYLSLF